MAWKNPATTAPDFDTGPGLVITTSPVELYAGGLWLVGAEFINNHATEERTVYLTDSAGAQVHQITLPPNGASDPYETPFRPLTGLKVYADDDSVTGHLWGYTDA